MLSRFFPSQEKWSMAIQEALSKASTSKHPGNIRQISFSLGKPGRGKLPVSVEIDGHGTFFCEVSDTYPVLEDIRDWMERCLTYDRHGTFHPEIMTLNLAESVYSFALIQVGWEQTDRGDVPVSLFIVVSWEHEYPLLCEFCYPVDTLSSLYRSITNCLCTNRRLFDNPNCWYDVKRFNKLNAESNTDRLLTKIKSYKIDMYCNFYRAV